MLRYGLFEHTPFPESNKEYVSGGSGFPHRGISFVVEHSFVLTPAVGRQLLCCPLFTNDTPASVARM